MPICYSFLNFRFFFFLYNFLSSVCSIVVHIKFCFCSTQHYRFCYYYVPFSVLSLFDIVFPLMNVLFILLCMFNFLFFLGRFCYVFRLKRLWSYAFWFANVGFYCIWLIAVANNKNIHQIESHIKYSHFNQINKFHKYTHKYRMLTTNFDGPKT